MTDQELIEQVRLKIQKHYEPYRADEEHALDIITIVQRHLVARMIADQEAALERAVLPQSRVAVVYAIAVLDRFLPDATSPQEDQIAHSVHLEVTDAMRKAAGRVFLEKTGGKPFGGPSGVMQEALNAALDAAFSPKEPFSD